ncbi:hypothetical protein [Paraburkholderia fungorum]|mgnify:CR=1 FL=1|jgi:hypothetical protein|uniref:Uncharacterized protein n=1 Tax=Paraburkholderia fungorum TaxID=134537 RepID=A0AAP5QHT4_9BURK|nr:hypothetical protein [Paraburkholderia fungorum]MBU7441217.1 hypothetical protein [Paraburkholderia fungorum]MDT8843953.1 hypothetical protein [Paraburkholderia fungorum]PRZ53353.1 hypothetical protein BX589_11035 [Paraburkholderia fungorum]PZR49349.1 MAG: hypothetical protein DI523_07755 [Paraburkholderia fungorum]USX10499.1 hypothetical protein NHH62_28150 [Paraburkholderia fungorum]
MLQLAAARSTRIMAGLIAATCVSVAAIGWLHTSHGRQLLAKLGVPCPVDTVDSNVVLSMRNNAISRQRGSIAAPDRPALGLQLDRSTESEVAEQMTRDNVHCDEISRGFRYLRCRGVPAQLLRTNGPPVSEIWFSFKPDRTLMAINLYRRDMTESETRQSWRIALQSLRQALGVPTAMTGDTTLTSLMEKPVAVARVEYAYSDYVATVTASHLPYGGLAVREQYMSATTAH